jgi:2-methylisocitrate lyase-like PEP mutase family enzyme
VSGADFLALHVPGSPLLMPNPWDVGSARLLESMGFTALATTSSGFAASLGRLDGGVTRDQAVAHAGALAEAVSVPVSADLEHLFSSTVEGVAETARLACATGLAGFSIEDSTGDRSAPLFDAGEAAERVAAAVEVAHSAGLVVTARAEQYLFGQRSVDEVIQRLQSYISVGADVVFAPGLVDLVEIAAVVEAVAPVPVNVLAVPGCPPVADLASAGVARVSIGGAFAFAAYGALVEAATELQSSGTYGYRERSTVGSKAVREAFRSEA